MNITIEKQALIEGLTKVGKYTANNDIVPILNGIYLKVSEDEISLIGSNKESTIKYTISNKETFNIHQTGQVVLPKTFTDIVKKLPTGLVNISFTDFSSVSISSEKSLFTINGLDAVEYPRNTIVNKGIFQLKVSLDKFLPAIEQTYYCSSQNSNRAELKGINVTVSNKAITLVATNSLILSKYIIELDSTVTNEEIHHTAIIPGRWLFDAIRTFSTNEIEILFEENAVSLISEGIYLKSLLIEGKYPEINNALNSIKNMKNQFIIDRKELINSLEQVEILCLQGEKRAAAILIYENDKLSIVNTNKEHGEINVQLDYKLHGEQLEKLKLAFNPSLMLSHLRALQTANVTLGYLGNLNPVFFDSSIDKHIKLMLPMRIM
ncbi:DNA polymerase III subunit beta [Bacillus sp. AR18-7]|uniref:DNA polymerase III subunit beta n=1 Tax=Bacillus sp. AR18-7 TaxID=2217821 RepID=UPI0015D29E0E|nr:DNA polymerase III subunit beta [Bacillus sp. AR18-7]